LATHGIYFRARNFQRNAIAILDEANALQHFRRANAEASEYGNR